MRPTRIEALDPPRSTARPSTSRRSTPAPLRAQSRQERRSLPAPSYQRSQNQRVLQIVWWRATVVLRDLRVGPQEWDSTTARSETRDAVFCEGRSCSCTALVTRQFSHDARCPSLLCFDY